LTDKELEFVKKFLDFKEATENSYYYDRYITPSDVMKFLQPDARRNYKDACNILSYEDRIDLAKIYLERIVSMTFSNNFGYYKNSHNSNKGYYETMLSNSGIDCYVDVAKTNEEGFPLEFNKKNENFFYIFLDGLYKYWDKQLEYYKNNQQEAVEIMFESQCNGTWFYYNHFNYNFLKVYLEYLKSRGFKINIFELFNKKLKRVIKSMDKGLAHYTKSYLFESLAIIFDFYNAILDIYGEDNEKVINKLQNNLITIFKDEIETEKFGFMNTFLYTKRWTNNSKNRSSESTSDVVHFWEYVYNNELNPTLKRIFLNAIIHTWNKSPIPKVRNSMQLLVDLATYKYDGRSGFPYHNQRLFYNDIIANANMLKKSVKSILFSKAILEEGGLFL